MTIGAAMRLLERLSSGPKEKRELYGFWSKEEIIEIAVDIGWVEDREGIVRLTDKGRRALAGRERQEAFSKRLV